MNRETSIPVADASESHLRALGRPAFRAGLTISLVLALLPPSILFLFEFGRASEQVATEARAQANLVARVVVREPTKWIHLTDELAGAVVDVRHPAHQSRITTIDGAELLVIGGEQPWPTVQASQEFLLAGTAAGSVTITSSIREEVIEALLVSLASGVLGAILFFPLYRLHLANMRRASSALAASEARFRELAGISSDWVWEQDTEFRFVEMSSGLARARLSNVSTLGKRRWELPIPLSEADWAAHKADLAAHRPFSDLEYPIMTDDGLMRWFSISGRPMFDSNGNFLGYRGTGRDISRAKEAERALREHRDHLQELVDERTADLVAAKDEAERANRAKSEFLSNMSHELRTPMHGILSCARLGADKAGKVDPERLREYFKLIRESGQRLLILLNDLLDLAKLEAGRMDMHMAPMNLAELVQRIACEQAALFELHKLQIAISVDGDSTMEGDANRLAQVVTNLFSNASKFAPAGSRIEVAIRPGEIAVEGQLFPALSLTVCDQGPGIPEADLERIFDKFVQSSQTADGSGGTGLGLAICHEIVRAHWGIIKAENRADGGACFTVLLPQNGRVPAILEITHV